MDNNKVNLYDVLKSGYNGKDQNKSKDQLKKNGYIYDKYMSSDNHQVYFNPNNKKLLYNVTGTHNLKDVITDGYLALGSITKTSRYKEDANILRKSKLKYGVDSATITGHSLGGSIGGLIANKNDKVNSLDSGFTIGSGIRKNNNAYRTAGDAVSFLGSNKTKMKTLKNPSFSIFSNPLSNIYNAHNVDNIKNSKLFI